MSCTWGKLPVYESDDLVFWKRTNSFLLPSGHLSWALSGMSWAPELTKIDDRYIAYFTQEDKSNNGAIGGATSNSITANFQEINSPLLTWPLAGVIDPSYFKDPATNKHYLLSKVDGNSVGIPTEILLSELNESGTALKNKNHIHIKREGGKVPSLIEGQDLFYYDGFYYLFYSAGDFASNYEVWVARSVQINGPYYGDRRILVTRPGSKFYAPGHGTVLKVDKDHYYLYHAFIHGVRNRQAMLDRVNWIDGWPIIHNGYPSENPQAHPLSDTRSHAQIDLSWNSPEMRSVTYSLDAKSEVVGKKLEIAPCVDAGVLGASNAIIFNGNCTSANKQISLIDKSYLRICAAEYGVWEDGVICSKYASISEPKMRLVLPIQKVQVSWNNLGPEYYYSLDAKTKEPGIGEIITAPCIDAGVLQQRTSFSFNRRCQNNKLVLLDPRSSLRICASKNEWPKAICSKYREISSAEGGLRLDLPH